MKVYTYYDVYTYDDQRHNVHFMKIYAFFEIPSFFLHLQTQETKPLMRN